MHYFPISKDLLKDLPESPGVYFFLGKNRRPIYIGKAKNLKNRVSHYLTLALSGKTKSMVEEALEFTFIKVNTEIEALLLEAKLIRENMPKFNSEAKDDKSPLYIGITKDKYPLVKALRKTELEKYKLKNVYGPFTQGSSVRYVMRLIRRIFPYTHHLPTKKTCIYNQIGLCRPCPSEIEIETDLKRKNELTREFRKNVFYVNQFLKGRFKTIEKDLEKQMRELSKNEDFEKAQELKKKLDMINHLTTQSISPSEYLKDPNFIEDIREKELEELKNIISPFINIKSLKRIECFDIAHLQGTHPTASMVTFISAEADKRYYRHFSVKRLKGNSDVDSMKHVLLRRRKRFDEVDTGWGRPDLIIVDGGKPQVSKALEVITEVPLIGLAKQFETLVIKTAEGFKEVRLKDGPAKNLVQRMRDEAHRFSRRLHHKHVARALFPNSKEK